MSVSGNCLYRIWSLRFLPAVLVGCGLCAPALGVADSPAAALSAIDTCALLDDADIASVGGTGPGQPFVRPAVKGVQWDSCTWGTLTSGKPMVIVQVQQLHGEPMNALQMLLRIGDTPRTPATPVGVSDDGKLYNVAILAGGGGGGVGKSIAFTVGGSSTVAVSVTGETVDVPALTALARRVESRLGR